MKVSVDDKECFSLTEIQKRVIMNDIPEDIFHEDMKRRLQWIINHKYEECFKRLKAEWEPKFKLMGLESIPLNDEKFANLCFEHPEYKNRSQREKEVM